MKKLYYIILFLMITSGINAQWKYSSQDGSQIRSLNKNGDILYATTIYNIYTSKDEGLTWQASKISHNVFSRSEFAFRNETAFLASSSRIYRSNDQGTSWKEILYSDNANLKTIIVKGDTIFAAGLYSFHRSYDDGKTWTEIDLSNPAEELYIEDLELKGDSLFASCQYGLYFSIDQGNTWKKTNPAGVNYPGQLIQFKNTFLILIYKDMLASTDNGKSWTSTGLSASWVTTNNSVAYACSKDGIYSSNDGIIWSKISNYPFPTTWGLLTVTGSNFCLGTALGIYTSTNAGVTWTFTSKGIEALDVSDIIQTTDAIYAGTSGGLMTSIDNGTHWTNLTPGIAATCL
ncbi:MAG TPA: hypothetical protein PK289_06460, partial [Bacteroidia bacterium]|nr:hypothetical protein [Bacteroidia bacterium]